MEITAYSRSDAVGAAAPAGGEKSAAGARAMLAGIFIAIAASLTLLALGSGFGFASMSSGTGHEILGTTFVLTTAIWLIMTQWISAGLGGYIAGRLRSRWVGSHTRRIFFRDAARGLVTWAVATAVVAALAGPMVLTLISGRAQAASAVASGLSDTTLLAAGATDNGQAIMDPTVGPYRILGNTLAMGTVPIIERAYGAGAYSQPLAPSAWLTRGVAAEALIYTAISLLIGAYIASIAAGLGGVFRDERP